MLRDTPARATTVCALTRLARQGHHNASGHGPKPRSSAGLLPPRPPPVAHLGIEHRRPDVLVTEQFLHGADVIPRFESMGGKGMPPGMTRGGLRDACLANRDMPSPLEHLFVGMMPPDNASARVA